MADLHQLVVQNGDQTENQEAHAGGKSELSVDEIIEQHVGSLGFSQMIQVVLVSLAWVFDSQNTLVTIFSDAQPKWRCKAVSPPHSCSSSMCGLDRGAWEWVGGRKSSTIAEWELICGDKFRAGIPASSFFIGSLFGSLAHGRLSDSYLGRKKTVILSCLLTSLTAFLTSLSPNVWIYALLRFSNGFSRSGIGICCLVLATEVVGRRWRGQVGQYGFFFFTIGFLSLPALAYPTRASWRNLYRLISAFPLAYSVLFLPFVSESPRWLATKGRTDEAMSILSNFASGNGKTLPNNITISNSTASNVLQKPESLWSAKWATKRVVKTMIAGLGIGFVYYGVQLNVENLNFNLYFTVGVNALVEIPAVLVGSVLLSCTRRQILFSSSAFAAGCACILCIIFAGKEGKSKGSWGQLSVEAVGFMAASMAFDVLYIYCVELFPTNVRNFAVSMLRQSLMLGAALAPLLVVLGRVSPAISFVVFGGLAICSGVVAFWLPETRNAPLYETLEQQEKEERLGAAGLVTATGVELAQEH